MKIFLILFSICLNWTILHAQEEIPLPDQHWKLFQIPNTQISVLHIQNTQNPVFQAELHLPLGYSIQDSSNIGILNLFSQLFFNTTQTFSTNISLQEHLKEIGLEYNYRISSDVFQIEVLAPAPHALVAMQMLRDWVLYPKISDLDWTRAKMMYARWLQKQEENPSWLLKSETNKLLWGKQAAKLENTSNFTALSKYSLEQFMGFREFWLYPNQGLLTICSPMQPEKLENLLDSVWGKWKLAEHVPQELIEKEPTSVLSQDTVQIITFEKTKIPQALLSWSPDTSIQGFLPELITRGLVKWLNWSGHPIQKNRNLWNWAEFSFEPNNFHNTLEMNLIARVGDWKIAWDSLRESFLSIKNYTITDDETTLIKDWLLSDMDFAHESPIDFAHGLGNHWVRFENKDYIYLKDSILSMTTEQIQTVKDQWFNQSHVCIAFISNSLDQTQLQPETWLLPQKTAPFPIDTLSRTDTLIVSTSSDSTSMDSNRVVFYTEKQTVAEIPFDSIETEKEQFFFELNSYKVDTVSKEKLESFAKILHKYPELRIKLHGHSDTQGNAAYNMILSQKRVEAVRWLLIHWHKIDAKRIYTKAWGETKPAYIEDKPENIAKNRRVELEIFVP